MSTTLQFSYQGNHKDLDLEGATEFEAVDLIHYKLEELGIPTDDENYFLCQAPHSDDLIGEIIHSLNDDAPFVVIPIDDHTDLTVDFVRD